MKKIIAIFLSVWTTVSVFSSNDFTPPEPQPEPEYIYKFEPDAERLCRKSSKNLFCCRFCQFFLYQRNNNLKRILKLKVSSVNHNRIRSRFQRRGAAV